ncbi:ADP-ribosyltransferase [Sneathia vaginalis]|uniref:ADP-ribosyltransferase n=1 Tax=Sneathia vaginalis TaxID=187101 RepID=UPI0035C71E04
MYKTLTDYEREALSEYTQGGYLDINYKLANGIENKYTKGLNSSIAKFSMQDNIITYRRTS